MATKKKTGLINPYNGSGHRTTYDNSVLRPKSASPNKYATIENPKGRSNHVKVSPEYYYPTKGSVPKSRSSVEIRKANVAKATKPTKRRTK